MLKALKKLVSANQWAVEYFSSIIRLSLYKRISTKVNPKIRTLPSVVIY